MNRNLLLAGGTFLIIGGVAYWYLSRENGNGECVSGTEKCVGNDLYRCINGKWELIEAASPTCINPCEGDCGAEGFTACRGDNLCICTNGNWQLLERNSSKCLSGKTHKECFVTQDGYSVCLDVPGHGTNKCWGPNFPSYGSQGCSCAPPKKCYPEFYCDTDYTNLCMDYAVAEYIEAVATGPEPEEASCYLEDTTGSKMLAGNILTGEFYYKWAWPGDMIRMKIAVGVGNEYTWIYDETHIIYFGGDGSITINKIFERQAIEWIYFYGRGGFGGRIDKFVGILSSAQ